MQMVGGCYKLNRGNPLRHRVDAVFLSGQAWTKPRWVIGIRQHIEQRAAPKGKTLNLFADDPVIGKWRFSALATDLDLPAMVIWRTYRGRLTVKAGLRSWNMNLQRIVSTWRIFGQRKPLSTRSCWPILMSLLRQVLLKTSTVKHSSTSVQHTLKRCDTNYLQRRATSPLRVENPS